MKYLAHRLYYAGSNVPDSYDWSGNDDHAHEVVSGYRPHHNESLLPDLNEVSIYIYFFLFGVKLTINFYPLVFLACYAPPTVVTRSERV